MLSRKFLYRLDKTALDGGKGGFQQSRSRQRDKAYARGKEILVPAKHLADSSLCAIPQHCASKPSGRNYTDLCGCVSLIGFHELQPEPLVFEPSTVFSDRKKLIRLP